VCEFCFPGQSESDHNVAVALDWDEQQAPASLRSAPASLLHPWKSSGDAIARTMAPGPGRAADRAAVLRRQRPLIVIQRQLGHPNLGVTSIYLQGIDNTEIIDTVHARRAAMVPVHSSLRP
jgi:hypothetical protein